MCTNNTNDYSEQIWEVLKDLRDQYQWNKQCKVIQLVDAFNVLGVVIALDSDGRVWRSSKDGNWKQLKGPDLDKVK